MTVTKPLPVSTETTPDRAITDKKTDFIVEGYDQADSFQIIAPDLTVGADVGKSGVGTTAHIAAIMGNLIGDSLTKTKNYLAGIIGKFSVTGAKATTYPAGAVLADIGDGVTEADGAVVAFIDGDSALTKANAAFKAMSNNSVPGSGFDFGLDLHGPAHDGYNTLAILKADIRMSDEICILHGSGDPVNLVTGLGFAEQGSLYIDVTGAALWINDGDKVTPNWAQLSV